jgi:hypothetical protein
MTPDSYRNITGDNLNASSSQAEPHDNVGEYIFYNFYKTAQHHIMMDTDPVFYMVIDNLLGKDYNSRILEELVRLKAHFIESGISPTHEIIKTYRNNTNMFMDTLYPLYDVECDQDSCCSTSTVQKREEKKMAALRRRAENSPLLRAIDGIIHSDYMKELMDHTPFPCCKFRVMDTWETQVSRYGGGLVTDDNEFIREIEGEKQFYTWHSDRITESRGSVTTAPDNRIVTMIYYVCKEPKHFRGGELFLSNGVIHGGKIVSAGDRRLTLEPKNDRLVVFNSRTVHSVAPTSSKDVFEEGRFSVNIWLGRRDPLLPRDLF